MPESNTWVVGSYATGTPQATRFLTTLPPAAAAVDKVSKPSTTSTTSMAFVAGSVFPAQKCDPETKEGESQVVQLPGYCSSPGVFVVCVDLPAYWAGIRGALGRRLRRVLYTMVVAGEFISATAFAIDDTVTKGLVATSAHKTVELASGTATYMAEAVQLGRLEADQSALTSDATAKTLTAVPEMVVMATLGFGSVLKTTFFRAKAMTLELSEYIVETVHHAQVAATPSPTARTVGSRDGAGSAQRQTVSGGRTVHRPQKMRPSSPWGPYHRL